VETKLIHTISGNVKTISAVINAASALSRSLPRRCLAQHLRRSRRSRPRSRPDRRARGPHAVREAQSPSCMAGPRSFRRQSPAWLRTAPGVIEGHCRAAARCRGASGSPRPMRSLMIAVDTAWHAVGGPRRRRLPVSTATAAAASGAQDLEETVPVGSANYHARIRNERHGKPTSEKTPAQNSKLSENGHLLSADNVVAPGLRVRREGEAGPQPPHALRYRV